MLKLEEQHAKEHIKSIFFITTVMWCLFTTYFEHSSTLCLQTNLFHDLIQKRVVVCTLICSLIDRWCYKTCYKTGSVARCMVLQDRWHHKISGITRCHLKACEVTREVVWHNKTGAVTRQVASQDSWHHKTWCNKTGGVIRCDCWQDRWYHKWCNNMSSVTRQVVLQDIWCWQDRWCHKTSGVTRQVMLQDGFKGQVFHLRLLPKGCWTLKSAHPVNTPCHSPCTFRCQNLWKIVVFKHVWPFTADV